MTDQPTGTRPEIDPELDELLGVLIAYPPPGGEPALIAWHDRKDELLASLTARLTPPPSAPTGEDARKRETWVSTGELANAFIAAHDTSLASSNPEWLGRERAIAKGRALDAGVEAVRARLHAAAPAPPDDVRERVRTVLDNVTKLYFPDGIPFTSDLDMMLADLEGSLLTALADARPAEGSA